MLSGSHARDFLCAVLLTLCLPGMAAASGLAAIEILPQSGERHFSGWRQDTPLAHLLEVPLELGDEIHGATLRLTPADPDGEYRVHVQYETSLGISAEGPHVDLLDWKHCVSGWEPARPGGAHAFVLPVPSQEQADCFPAFGHDELVAATRQAVSTWGDAEAWVRMLDAVRQAGDVPTFVAISKVRVRVQALRDGEWTEVTTLEFMPPMGC